jgi:hypothetical protein
VLDPGRGKTKSGYLWAIARDDRPWKGLTRFLDDGRIEIDSNTVERSIRPIALTRKNALFAGHDWGGTAPPAIAYSYAPGRGGEHAIALYGPKSQLGARGQ